MRNLPGIVAITLAVAAGVVGSNAEKSLAKTSTWLLVAPPRTGPHQLLNEHAPLDQWANYGKYDSFAACHKAHGDVYSRLREKASPIAAQFSKYARCFPEDDPRLRKETP